MKTVYILGAGFSVEAGAPSQEKIMECIFRDATFRNTHPDDYNEFIGLLSRQMNYSEEQFKSIPLEDIFTPLDRCLADNISFRGLKAPEILKAREAAFNLIGMAIRNELNKTDKSKNYIDDFAKLLVEKSSVRKGLEYRKKDPVSVISTNWDILLDNSIHNYIQEKHVDNAVVDYCCYISSLDPLDESIKPGLEQLGKGGFNVKLIKLHGSLNWLQCPRCMRIYTGFDKKNSLNKNINCRHCDKNFEDETSNHKLISNLIMPTFIKDLSNPQYKIIWQNAGVEIAEADKLVFIGYSLPSADFEMRQLLSRMTRNNAEITVVDYKVKPEETDEKIAIQKRWSSFFGRRKILFDFEGASNFITNNLGMLNK